MAGYITIPGLKPEPHNPSYFPADETGQRSTFAKRTVSQLLMRYSADPDLAGAGLVLEAAGVGAAPGGGDCKKLAKKLLKAHQGNLFLWAAYASAELARGAPAEARKVLHAAMQLFPSLAPADRFG